MIKVMDCQSRDSSGVLYGSLLVHRTRILEVIDSWKVLTQDRTDHFSTKNLTNGKLAGCYLFIVSNSGLLFSRGCLVLPHAVHL